MIKKIIIGLAVLLILCLLGFYLLLTWRPKFDTRTDAGFLIDHVKISNVKLLCGRSEPGHIKTYYVDCEVEMDVEHPEQFIPNNKVLLISSWKTLETISKTDRENLFRLKSEYPGFRPLGMLSRREYSVIGVDHSAIIETKILPLFVLNLGVIEAEAFSNIDSFNREGDLYKNEKPKQRKKIISHIKANFVITVSMIKCEIFRIGAKNFYQCFDFGSK